MNDRLNQHPLSQWLVDKIKESGLSQAELSRRSGVSQAQISRFLDDHPDTHQSIRIKNADKLLVALETQMGELLKEKANSLAALSATQVRMEGEIEYWRSQRDDLCEVIIATSEAKEAMDRAKEAMDIAARFADKQLHRIQLS
jgi:transcriptional regulator with XRE-family HTH domain